MTKSITNMFEKAVSESPEKTAIVTETGERVTFATLNRISNNFSARLAVSGVAAGEIVAGGKGNLSVMVALWLATLRLGAIPCISRASPAKAMEFGVPVDWALVTKDDPIKGVKNLIVDQSWLQLKDPVPEVQPSAGMIFATSGSTGKPKFMHLSPGGMERRIAVMTKDNAISGPVMIGSNYQNAAALRLVFGTLVAGHTLVFGDRDPRKLLMTCQQENVSELFTTPSQLRELLAAIREGDIDVPSIANLRVGGGPASGVMLREAEKQFRTKIQAGYGTSEVGMIALGVPSLNQNPEPGLNGPALDHLEVQIVDENGDVLPAGQTGILKIRGPRELMIQSYFDGSSALDADGWSRPGDWAKMREDGWLVIEGRRDDLINTGGNVYTPEAFEDLVRPVRGVTDVAAFPVTSSDGFHDIGMAIVTGKEYREENLQALLTRRFGAAFRFHIFSVASLPMTNSGKVARAELLEIFKSISASPGPNAKPN